MNANDIRQLNLNCQEAATATETPRVHDVALWSLELSLLAEIAAQLAQLNEGLDYVSRSECLNVRVTGDRNG